MNKPSTGRPELKQPPLKAEFPSAPKWPAQARRSKILHVITSLDDGGAEAVLFRLIRASAGYEHCVVSLSGRGKYGPLLEAAAVKVVPLHMERVWGRVMAFFRLLRLIKQCRPDVVQTWMYHANLLGGLAARAAGVHEVHWGIHNSAVLLKDSPFGRWVVVRMGALLSRFVPRSIVCCSQAALRTHSECGYRVDKLQFIPNGCPTDEFRPNPALRSATRETFGVGEGEVLIGHVARLDPQKDHATLLKALSILKEKRSFKCILVGRGVDEDRGIAEAIKSLDLRGDVVCTGARSDIPAVMNALDLLVSSSYSEAFPNVLCEAMACGTPCAATDVGDSRFIVGKTGWTAQRRDSASLAAALDAAIGSLPDEARRAAARRRILDNFSLERMAASYSALWAIDSGPESHFSNKEIS